MTDTLTPDLIRDRQRQNNPQTLEDIQFAWQADVKSDLEPSKALMKIAQLHGKYSDIMMQKMKELRKINADYSRLYKAKYSYYRGDMNSDPEELKRRGWEPNPKKVDTTQLKVYLDGDDDLIALKERVGYAEDLVNYLEGLLKQNKDRGFQLQAKIKWDMFIHDGSE
jgi:hypothetical protein